MKPDWQFSKGRIAVCIDEQGNIRITDKDNAQVVILSISEINWLQRMLEAMDYPTAPPRSNQE